MAAHRESPQSSDGSHASTWITVIVAVPLLYLLTLPAVVAVAVPSGSTAIPRAPKWLEMYLGPVVWLSEFEAFSVVYAAYCNWCWKTVLKRTDVV